MKKKRATHIKPKDTPATRRLRLQERLQEISERGEQELATLTLSVEEMKATLKLRKVH